MVPVQTRRLASLFSLPSLPPSPLLLPPTGPARPASGRPLDEHGRLDPAQGGGGGTETSRGGARRLPGRRRRQGLGRGAGGPGLGAARGREPSTLPSERGRPPFLGGAVDCLV